ncbi:MAG: toxin-antitoxin system YwqK family antitoxin [Myxococcaceae bacterium]
MIALVFTLAGLGLAVASGLTGVVVLTSAGLTDAQAALVALPFALVVPSAIAFKLTRALGKRAVGPGARRAAGAVALLALNAGLIALGVRFGNVDADHLVDAARRTVALGFGQAPPTAAPAIGEVAPPAAPGVAPPVRQGQSPAQAAEEARAREVMVQALGARQFVFAVVAASPETQGSPNRGTELANRDPLVGGCPRGTTRYGVQRLEGPGPAGCLTPAMTPEGPVVYFDREGYLVSEGHWSGGKRHGVQRDWVQRSMGGAMISEWSCQRGVLDGLHRIYEWKGGTLRLEESFRDGRAEGPYRSFETRPGYTGGEEGQFADDRATGTWSAYANDGTVSSVRRYGSPGPARACYYNSSGGWPDPCSGRMVPCTDVPPPELTGEDATNWRIFNHGLEGDHLYWFATSSRAHHFVDGQERKPLTQWPAGEGPARPPPRPALPPAPDPL